MKIGQQPELTPAATAATPVTPRNGQNQAGGVSRAERKAAPAPGVGVTVSEAARTLEQAGSNDAADVDLAKVESVRQAIAQNTYTVNAENIADKLLANARDMLNRTPS